MPNSLIYAPSFDGHRQVHVFVYAHILNELGYKIFIAGNLDEKIIDSSYIDRLKKDKSVTIIHTNADAKKNSEISKDEFIELQNSCEADLTIFVEADNHIPLFTSQIFNKKKLRGKTVGLFLRPFSFYKKRNFWDKLRYIKHLFSYWRTDEFLFHKYLLKRFRLLNSPLYVDENFVSKHNYSHLLPDVFQRYAEILVKEENKEQQIWNDQLTRFKEANKDRFIFFYFGTAQKRRGYDLLLKMAIEFNACFVHCGLNHEKEKYDLNITELKNVLLQNGRLMETNQYISDPLCIEYFFKSVDHLVLPYQDFLGSSGVMLQALSYGIPVLVPDKGLMGYLVNKYKLGFTYNDTGILTAQIKRFKETPKEIFKNSIEEYMKHQSPEQLKKVLVNIFDDKLKLKTDREFVK